MGRGIYQLDGVNEWNPGDFVFAHSDHGTWYIRRTFQDCLDRFYALHCRQISIECTWNTTPLRMSQGRDSRVETKFLREQVFEVIG